MPSEVTYRCDRLSRKEAQMQKIPNLVTKVPRLAKPICLKESDLVVEHNAIASRRGKVLFGRIGKGLASSKVNVIREAIDAGLKPMLFLVRKGDEDFEFFRAEMSGIWGADFTPDSTLCPSYYRELFSQISLWIEIGQFSKVSSSVLERLRLSSTGRPILELLGSQASLMLADSCDVPNR